MIHLTRFSVICAGISLLAATSANAYSVNFQGSVTIDFSSDPNLGSLLGLKTLTINQNLDLPDSQAAIFLSLADGDSSLPIAPLLNGWLPQEVLPGLTLNSLTINSFSGSGTAVATSGDNTGFLFQYNPIDPVLGIPVLEISNFNQNLNQCVTNQCQLTSLTIGSLSAVFGITYQGIPGVLTTTLAPTSFSLQTTPLTPIPEPASVLGILFGVGLGATVLKRA